MLVGGLDQVRKRLKQQLGQYEYKQMCESLMIQSSNNYATTENSSFKCQEYDIVRTLFRGGENLMLQFVNTLHSNLRFTLEKETAEHGLPFFGFGA